MCSVNNNASKFAAASANSPFKMPDIQANPELTNRVSESVGSLGVLGAVTSNKPFSFAGGNDLGAIK
jgi:hypothetical protein